MKEKAQPPPCCTTDSAGQSAACCRVEALISMDARGQLVLPKDVRERAQIQPGDKLAVVSFQREGVICCISLMKADTFGEMVKEMLGPMMSEIIQ